MSTLDHDHSASYGTIHSGTRVFEGYMWRTVVDGDYTLWEVEDDLITVRQHSTVAIRLSLTQVILSKKEQQQQNLKERVNMEKKVHDDILTKLLKLDLGFSNDDISEVDSDEDLVYGDL